MSPLGCLEDTGTNRRSVGSLVSAPEECLCTGFSRAGQRRWLEDCSRGYQVSHNCLVFAPAKLTTRLSVVCDLGLPQPGKKLGHGIERWPSPRAKPGWRSSNYCWHTLKHCIRSSQNSEGGYSTTANPDTQRESTLAPPALQCSSTKGRQCHRLGDWSAVRDKQDLDLRLHLSREK